MKNYFFQQYMLTDDDRNVQTKKLSEPLGGAV